MPEQEQPLTFPNTTVNFGPNGMQITIAFAPDIAFVKE